MLLARSRSLFGCYCVCVCLFYVVVFVALRERERESERARDTLTFFPIKKSLSWRSLQIKYTHKYNKKLYVYKTHTHTRGYPADTQICISAFCRSYFAFFLIFIFCYSLFVVYFFFLIYFLFVAAFMTSFFRSLLPLFLFNFSQFLGVSIRYTHTHTSLYIVFALFLGSQQFFFTVFSEWNRLRRKRQEDTHTLTHKTHNKWKPKICMEPCVCILRTSLPSKPNPHNSRLPNAPGLQSFGPLQAPRPATAF